MATEYPGDANESCGSLGWTIREDWGNLPQDRPNTVSLIGSEEPVPHRSQGAWVFQAIDRQYAQGRSRGSIGFRIAVTNSTRPEIEWTLRLCLGYRRLNAMTNRNSYPLPRMDDGMDSLGNEKLFTALDANCGYWKLPAREKDKEKPNFAHKKGCNNWKGCLSGLLMHLNRLSEH